MIHPAAGVTEVWHGGGGWGKDGREIWLRDWKCWERGGILSTFATVPDRPDLPPCGGDVGVAEGGALSAHTKLSVLAETHPPLSLRDISPARGEIGNTFTARNGRLHADWPGAMSHRPHQRKKRRSPGAFWCGSGEPSNHDGAVYSLLASSAGAAASAAAASAAAAFAAAASAASVAAFSAARAWAAATFSASMRAFSVA